MNRGREWVGDSDLNTWAEDAPVCTWCHEGGGDFITVDGSPWHEACAERTVRMCDREPCRQDAVYLTEAGVQLCAGCATALGEARCTADAEHPCDAGFDPHTLDHGPCPSCARWLKESEADARRAWEAASPAERDPEGYVRDMLDGGRGHLLRPEELERRRH